MKTDAHYWQSVRKHDTDKARTEYPDFSAEVFHRLEIQTWTILPSIFALRIYRAKSGKAVVYHHHRNAQGRTAEIQSWKDAETRSQQHLEERRKANNGKRPLTGAAVCAQAIREELADRFPGTKFSVRSENFANGDSVHVYWQFGPTSKEVESVVNKYQAGWFDGMTDCYNYTGASRVVTPSGEVKQLPDAKYILCSRSFPESTIERAAREFCGLNGIPFTSLDQVVQENGDRLRVVVWRILAHLSMPNGYTFLRRVDDASECLRLEEFYILS